MPSPPRRRFRAARAPGPVGSLRTNQTIGTGDAPFRYANTAVCKDGVIGDVIPLPMTRAHGERDLAGHRYYRDRRKAVTLSGSEASSEALAAARPGAAQPDAGPKSGTTFFMFYSPPA